MLQTVEEKRGEWWAIGLDVTRHYNLAAEDRPHIARIIDTFMYDRSVRTHCCELTPSYWLVYLHTEIEWQGFPSDEVRERIDQRYAHEETDDIYVHCHEVEAARQMNVAYGEPATQEEAREYWQGNCPF